MKKQLLLSLVSVNVNLRLAHWQADTITNAHRVLGDLYEDMDELIDELVEVVIGKDLDVSFPELSINLVPNAAPKDLLAVGLATVRSLRVPFNADEDVLNLLADMEGKINRAKYLLKV